MPRGLFFIVPPLGTGFFPLTPMLGIDACTLYLGMIVTLPLGGHATWHAYRDLVARSGRGHGAKTVPARVDPSAMSVSAKAARWRC